MVKMEANGNGCLLCRRQNDGSKIIANLLVDQTGINLQDDGSLCLLCRLNHTHDGFDIINVECGNAVVACLRHSNNLL